MIVGGADGCRTGWVVCRRGTDGALDIGVVKTLAEACEGLSILAVDMPIGFVDVPRPPRACEVEARRHLPGKASSVFPTPCRPVLDCTTHAEANALSKTLGVGINQQTFHLFPKMREVDDLLCSRPRLKRLVHEAHPELALPGISLRASTSHCRAGRGTSTKPIGMSTAKMERPSQASARVFTTLMSSAPSVPRRQTTQPVRQPSAPPTIK